MEIRNLKSFLKVAELRSFTHAAKELGYSQANVSSQILQLEQEIGTPLFNRSGRTVTLTQYGEAMLPYARELCFLAQKMENMVRSEEFLAGSVRLGLTDSLSELYLEDAFLAYHRRFPRVRAEIVLDTTAKLLERLRRGELDAACVITEPLLPTEWQIWSGRETPIVVVANPSVPLAGKKTARLEELTALEFIWMEADAPYSLEFERALAEKHLECNPVFRLQSSRAACRMVERGPYASVLPEYAVREAVEEGRVAVLPVKEWDHRQAIQMILHRNRVLTPQIEGLLQELNRTLNAALE